MTLLGGHWVLAIKYMRVILKLPILLFPERVGDIQARMKKIACTIRTLNSILAALVFAYTLLFQLYIFGVWKGDYSAWLTSISIVLTLLPAVLLLVAVIKVRCMVRMLQSKEIFQKEKIILLHTVIFSLYVLSYIIETVTYPREHSDNTQAECKRYTADISLDICASLLNICIFALITHMSV